MPGSDLIKVAVIGGGPAGLTTAIALAHAGIETALVSQPPRPDSRTTALLAGSVTALETLGVWQLCAAHAAPLTEIRIVDATSRLLRAPEVAFKATEIDLDAFGYNIENRHLVAALDACGRTLNNLTHIEDTAQSIAIADDHVTIHLAGGESLRAQLVVGADGRQSLCRSSVGIAVERKRYPQAALTFTIRHSRPHNFISTEFHTETGPFTLVPLPGLRSSVVCVVEPGEADRLGALDARALSDEIEQRAHSCLGQMILENTPGIFPLTVERSETFGTRRMALVGEAAHVIPPIGAQGLNLGLRDAATISELVSDAHRNGEDVGGPNLLTHYDELRRADVMTRTMAIDAINRSLLTGLLPVHGARGLGLFLLDKITPLRRAVMREGVTPRLAEPRLMRGEAI